MRVLIKQSKVIDPQSPHHGKMCDILVKNGSIVKIKSKLNEEADKTITSANQCVTPGWMDGFGFFGEPGYEHKETLKTGLETAVRGGYTDVVAIPNTLPTASHASQIEYLKSASKNHITNLHPLGSVTKGIEGKGLAEMLEMQDAGAVAFSDGLKPVQDAGLMQRALEYSRSRQFVILNLPKVESLQRNGEMHESEYSVKFGLSGITPMSETLMVYRDIELARYHNAHIHIPAISLAESMAMIKRAKKEGVKVSCGVSPAHLIYTDQDLSNYNSNLKSILPLRSEKDRRALIKGIKNGDIDCINSLHLPQNPEEKELDFKNASEGMTMLQTTLPLLLQAGLSVNLFAEILGQNLRNILNLEFKPIVEKSKACLTVFDPEIKWNFDQKTNASLSTNSVLYGSELQGKVTAVLNNNKVKIL